MKDYYGILEVNENASQEIIEKAYKTLVKKYHPDLYSSIQKKEAEKKLRDINEAYNILSDRYLRGQYDLELKKERINAQIYENQAKENYQYQENIAQNTNQRQGRNKKETTFTINNTEYVHHKSNVGTIFGIVDLVKNIWSNKPKNIERKKISKTDLKALMLTIVVLIIIGIILWFLPFTNSWMRQLLFENPIFNFIGGLFS